MIFLLICSFIFSKIENTCSIYSEGTVFLEYYNNFVDEDIHLLDEYLEKNKFDTKIQKINCSKCTCPELEGFPTFKIYKDHKEIDSLTGHLEHQKLVQFVNKNINPDQNINRDNIVGIVELKEIDFYSSFDGPWLIHFYDKPSEEIDSLLIKVAGHFKNKLKIGKINEKESKNIIGRYNIRIFPVIFGIYEDLSSPFLEILNFENLVNFSNKLMSHPFPNINYDQLLQKINTNTQFYIVLYKNEKTADILFSKYAHNFKFKLEMYKTNDHILFDKLNPKYFSEVSLALYKNGKFHFYDQDIFNDKNVLEWIFHSHFPNVVKINDSTFHSVFNGLKPSFLLLTYDDYLIDEYEKFAKNVHAGMPFVKMVFASINLNEYVLFTQSLLPNIEIPTIVVYNPYEKIWYHKKIILKKKTFSEEAGKILKMYESGKMKIFYKKRGSRFGMMFWVLLITLICGVIYTNEYILKK
ncbi:thioredoxin domain-containing protein [Vairimorpha necatrix]|uniref:Thioredoxin domain-containing protein n=1 Tax=Vairimorpha necatrix TaxID=6039 RepID=A0AAX4JA73_9MICR